MSQLQLGETVAITRNKSTFVKFKSSDDLFTFFVLGRMGFHSVLNCKLITYYWLHITTYEKEMLCNSVIYNIHN